MENVKHYEDLEEHVVNSIARLLKENSGQCLHQPMLGCTHVGTLYAYNADWDCEVVVTYKIIGAEMTFEVTDKTDNTYATKVIVCYAHERNMGKKLSEYLTNKVYPAIKEVRQSGS